MPQGDREVTLFEQRSDEDPGRREYEAACGPGRKSGFVCLFQSSHNWTKLMNAPIKKGRREAST